MDKRISLRGVLIAGLLVATLTGCASTEFAAVNQEPGYYYGYGRGKTEAAAQEVALRDLVYNTFTESGSIPKIAKVRAVLTEPMTAAVRPLAKKPYMAEKRSDSDFTSIYRIKYADWSTAETTRLGALSATFLPRWQAIQDPSKGSTGARLVAAADLLADLDFQGVPLTLLTGASGTPKLADAVRDWASGLFAGAQLTIPSGDGMVAAGQAVPVILKTAQGVVLSGIPLVWTWAADSGAQAEGTGSTDPRGQVGAVYPSDTTFRNMKSTLVVSTAIGSLTTKKTFLANYDGKLNAQMAFRNAVVLANLKTNEVRIPGGTITIGAVSQDRRAGSKEKARSATVASFFMDVTPVTNAQFRSYLVTADISRSQWPDFVNDPQLGGDSQPVVGVTLAQAQGYAAWVSGQLGVKKRLPTEAEYEAAARAGQSVIYPWGDEAPTDGVRANYSGNPQFSSTSPVGSFANGANSLGLLDMVGNIWEWTTSDPDALITADVGTKIIKGGSWLDGPSELRISNRRAVDPAESATDLGFRLVREDQ